MSRASQVPTRQVAWRVALRASLLGAPVWMYALLAVTLASAAVNTVVLQDVARHQRALLTLADTRTAAYELSALEWQARLRGALPPNLHAESRRMVQDLRQYARTLEDLRHAARLPRKLHPHEAEHEALTASITAYADVTQRLLDLIAAGQLDAAAQLDETRVDPAFATLRTQASALRTIETDTLESGEALALLLTVLCALGALLTTGLLVVRLHRSLQQARAWHAEAQRQRDREERDSLTGLWNRQGLQRRFTLTQAAGPLNVAVLDLNGLKAINDLGGHAAGDAHLQRIARALDQAAAPTGTAARLGGDEFVLLLPARSEGQALSLLKDLNVALRLPGEARPPFAFGLTRVQEVSALERVLTLADAAMYEHKERQRAELGDSRLGPSVEEFTSRLEQLETPQEVLEEGVRLARDMLGFQGSTYTERRGDAFVLSRMNGELPGGVQHRLGHVVEAQRGLMADVLARSVTRWSNDYPSEPHVLTLWLEAGLKSVLMVPVRYGGRVMGVISLMHFGTWRVITPQARRLTEALASRLGHTFEQQVALEHLRRAVQGGRLALGAALEERDLETAGHTGRVVALAGALGEHLGLSETDLLALEQGASLHDIGKLAIPDAILLKPGPLDAQEWAVMQEHAARGFEIAYRLQGLLPATLDVIRHHHERWDGAGYPDRLRGEQIPLAARIFAVCDVFDALTHPRPYKAAWTREQAVAEISAQRGRHFDPRVADAFLHLLKEDAPEGVAAGLTGARRALETP